MEKIALIIKKYTQEGMAVAKEAVDILSEQGCELYLPDKSMGYIGQKENVFYRNESCIFDGAEAVIVLGGDGSIMRTAHRTRLPILGVNLGRIGYMAELETNELQMIKALLNDSFSIENRMMIKYSVEKNGKKTAEANVLNEIVLSKGGYFTMPEIELVCNREEVGKYFADGLICATPTGSTAYSLAAGGSIIDPGMECFGVSQICPQSFYAKPLIFGGESVLEFKKGSRGHGKVVLTGDGDFVCEIESGDVVTVKKSDVYTKLIKIKKNNFYSVMRSKMTEI